MTAELSVKRQFSFIHRERGWKYSAGGRNSKGTESEYCAVSLEVQRGQQFDKS